MINVCAYINQILSLLISNNKCLQNNLLKPSVSLSLSGHTYNHRQTESTQYLLHLEAKLPMMLCLYYRCNYLSHFFGADCLKIFRSPFKTLFLPCYTFSVSLYFILGNLLYLYLCLFFRLSLPSDKHRSKSIFAAHSFTNWGGDRTWGSIGGPQDFKFLFTPTPRGHQFLYKFFTFFFFLVSSYIL